MFILSCKILLGQLTFTFVNQVEVESSWELLTDKATITLPANLKLDHNKLSAVLKTGDKAEIQLGYNERFNTVFSGYVTHIKPKVPIEISCEDEMWRLKQKTISDSGRSHGLVALLQKHFSTYEIDALDIQIGNYYIDNLSGAQFLDSLKSDFGLYSFFRGQKLVVGRIHNSETAKHVRFKLDHNIVSDELEFKSKDQVQLKVKAISNNSDGTKTEVEIGTPEGELRTLNFYNLSKEELKSAAEREVDKFLYDGFRGSFTAFGEPFVRHGDIVELQHNASDKAGKYWVDEVKYSFGTGGYRQQIKLGHRA